MRQSFIMVITVILSACTATPDKNIQIQQSVLSTIAAMPSTTPPPKTTPYPSPTPFDLKGLFCEYQFCIGHPVDMAFFDVNVRNNPSSPSTYSQGIIAAFNGNFFIQLIWQLSPESADPQFMLDLILDKETDTRTGNLDVKLIRNMNVIYTPITSTATAVLPYGAVGAWICGDRAFAWKAYSPQEDNTQIVFDNSFSRFMCNR